MSAQRDIAARSAVPRAILGAGWCTYHGDDEIEARPGTGATFHGPEITHNEAEANRQRAVARLTDALYALAKANLVRRIAAPLAEVCETLRENCNQSVDRHAKQMRNVPTSAMHVAPGTATVRAAPDVSFRRNGRPTTILPETAPAMNQVAGIGLALLHFFERCQLPGLRTAPDISGFGARARIVRLALALIAAALPASGRAATEGDLWLPPSMEQTTAPDNRVVLSLTDPTMVLARNELSAFLSAPTEVTRAGGVRFSLTVNKRPIAALGNEGFSVTTDRNRIVTIAANRPIGVLYGAFAWLRIARSGGDIAHLALRSQPRLQLRLLDHWDNADGFVERGYAGRSLWKWDELPGRIDPRYRDYARANASVGINGVVVNNVNADARFLTASYLDKLAALAGVLRPWGIRTYLAIRWDAPIGLGGLPDADPLDPRVAAWWRAKVAQIYAKVPDFGGFLVKAGSEGQPGPGQYGRSHAEGANMLAGALDPWGGSVMWRAFVYAHDNPDDRAKQAYDEFKPLDGQFAANVLVQVKNGPIDFQPREPAHPLFGAMPRTQLMPEFQITKEYLGQASHLVYLGPLFAETLQTDTLERGPGSTIARIAAGRLHAQRLTGMAGVANIGDAPDWCGSVFNQANWYAFGRLAWDPDLSADAIAREWAAQTFATAPADTRRIAALMARSREAVVDYMTPLGLAHQMGTGHHYGPAPWVADLPRPEWNPVYYHRADRNGIGFDRSAGGSNAAAQYAPAIAARLQDPRTTDERYLLWFHHLPWTWRTRSGDPLWTALVRRYDRGVAEVAAMQNDWQALEPSIDRPRFVRTRDLLQVQRQEAQWWRDASIAYFQSINRLPLPAGTLPPPHDLAWYQAQRFTDIAGTPN